MVNSFFKYPYTYDCLMFGFMPDNIFYKSKKVDSCFIKCHNCCYGEGVNNMAIKGIQLFPPKVTMSNALNLYQKVAHIKSKIGRLNSELSHSMINS